MFKNIDEALDWIVKKKRNNHSFDLFRSFMEKLNNPQDKLKIIHVAGTNGKGSTVTFLRDMFINNGYHVGTLQSPHYLSHLDRIRLDGNNIPEETFVRLLNQYYELFVKEDLGMFEIDYVIAVMFFLEEKVDYALIETGIGGRLDSTNVVNKPILSIITNIGYDHQDMLGDTLEEICQEKCGIIKKNSNTIVGYIDDNLKNIVRERCESLNNKYHECQNYTVLSPGTFEYNGILYSLNSKALYQIQNASLSLETYSVLSNLYGVRNDNEALKKALRSFKWSGRFEKVNDKPLIILDGAHNENGVRALMESFDLIEGTKCIVFSALKRKNYKEMYDILKKHCDEIVLTSFDYPGAIDISDIENEKFYSNASEAIAYAKNSYEVVLICGSLYFISDVAGNKLYG
ncbi:MAG: bifunctional folylpolyglutamate synthase/dihydrofolate synthase [Erysipelotrichaceae bacterium]